MSCAALLAAMFPGAVLADLDHVKVYEIPAPMVEQISLPRQLVARACARRHGIHWRIVKGG